MAVCSLGLEAFVCLLLIYMLLSDAITTTTATAIASTGTIYVIHRNYCVVSVL